MLQMILSLVLAAGLPAQPPQNANANPSRNPLFSGSRDSVSESVKSEDSVITVRGICKERSQTTVNSQDCKTIISKRQFERLMAALGAAGQPVPPNARRQLAQSYVDLLAFEQAARTLGIESSPEFQDLMDLVRLRTLADMYRRSLQAQYRGPSQQDIDDYYKQNRSSFIEIRLRRVMVPRRNPSVAGQQEYEKQALQLVNKLRERAVQGEDLNQLQKEGYSVLGLASPPGTDMGNRRKADLVADIQDEVLALEPGGVSKVEHEAYSFVIYKVDAKHLLPVETVHDEISREISRQRLDNALREATSGVLPEFNEDYFPSAPPRPTAQQPLATEH